MKHANLTITHINQEQDPWQKHVKQIQYQAEEGNSQG